MLQPTKAPRLSADRYSQLGCVQMLLLCVLFSLQTAKKKKKHDTETNTQNIGIVNQNMMLMTIKQMSTISNTLSKHYKLCTEPFDVRVNTYRINIIRFVLSHAKSFNTAHTHTEHHTTTRVREKRWS